MSGKLRVWPLLSLTEDSFWLSVSSIRYPGPTLCPGLPTLGPFDRLLRQPRGDSTLQALWPSGIKHLLLCTSSANGQSTAGLCRPSMGTTEEKPPGMGYNEGHFSLKMASKYIFLKKKIQQPHFLLDNTLLTQAKSKQEVAG